MARKKVHTEEEVENKQESLAGVSPDEQEPNKATFELVLTGTIGKGKSYRIPVTHGLKVPQDRVLEMVMKGITGERFAKIVAAVFGEQGEWETDA